MNRGSNTARQVPPLNDKQLRAYWAKVVKTPYCHVWTGGTTGHKTHPYGNFRIGERMFLAHRVAYYLSTGENPPAGMVIDHVCRVTRCVNPEHLEVVTQQENLARGERWIS